jgi:hypothetical protein
MPGKLTRAGGPNLCAYILIAGIAGITPNHGTLGDAVWADFAVNGGLAYELDARDLPDGWDHGFVPLGATHPDQSPALRVPGDVVELNPVLREAAYELTKDVELTDSPAAKRSRARYPQPAAQAEPRRNNTRSRATESNVSSTAAESSRGKRSGTSGRKLSSPRSSATPIFRIRPEISSLSASCGPSWVMTCHVCPS